MRFLIVDDEKIHRSGLKSLLLKYFPLLDISQARNGTEALEKLKNKKIDVLITDIKMPVMDGITLLKNVHEAKIKVKSIILSAFGEFSYARDAMKYGVVDYILKPVDPEQVHDIISDVIIDFENEKRHHEEASSFDSSAVKNSIPVYIDNVFSNYIRGRLDNEKTGFIDNIVQGNKLCRVVLFSIENFENICIKQVKIGVELRHRIIELFHGIFKSARLVLPFFDQYEEGHIYLLLFYDDFSSHLIEDIIILIRKVRRKLEEITSSECLCVLSDETIDFSVYPSELTELMENAVRMGFYHDDNFFYSKSGYKLVNSFPINTDEQQDSLKDAVKSLDSQGVIVSTSQLLNHIISKSGFINPTYLKEQVFELIKEIVQVLSLTMNKEEVKSTIINLKQTIENASDFNELKNSISNCLLSFSSYRSKMLNNSNKKMINKVLDYMNKHYCEDLSLQMMAEKAALSCPYFCTVFKDETGSNFSKYLLNVRLDNAKKLLSESDRKIYEVALQVGYKDPKYFDRVFKKESGMTPKEYRNLSAQLSIANNQQ